MEPLLTFTSEPSTCLYRSDQVWRLRYDVFADLTPADYMEKLRGGWRRFGPAVFRPECPSCSLCKSLRVPVATFRETESQRRAWKRNVREIEIPVAVPTHSAEKLDLYQRFHQYRHATKGWTVEEESSLDPFVENPFATEEWTYYTGERLVAVGYVDALTDGLSAIYFYWEPGERARSLGTFNILALIDAACRRGLPHVYLGYYVAEASCLSSMSTSGVRAELTRSNDWRGPHPRREELPPARNVCAGRSGRVFLRATLDRDPSRFALEVV